VREVGATLRPRLRRVIGRVSSRPNGFVAPLRTRLRVAPTSPCDAAFSGANIDPRVRRGIARRGFGRTSQCRAGFAGRGDPVARATGRCNLGPPRPEL